MGGGEKGMGERRRGYEENAESRDGRRGGYGHGRFGRREEFMEETLMHESVKLSGRIRPYSKHPNFGRRKTILT